MYIEVPYTRQIGNKKFPFLLNKIQSKYGFNRKIKMDKNNWW